jgi:DNA-binding CsgD family transcriptional regulator
LSSSDELAAFYGATAYVRAVADTGAGDIRFEQALTECPAERAFDRARIKLAQGMCLRRGRRVLESRLPLNDALAAFERLGAVAWAEHARRELRATGDRRVRREAGAVEKLTDQELQIVQLAAAGMTNREIGQRLYLSHRTVGSHLYRVFPKLGVAARSQLRDVLAELSALDATDGCMAH